MNLDTLSKQPLKIDAFYDAQDGFILEAEGNKFGKLDIVGNRVALKLQMIRGHVARLYGLQQVLAQVLYGVVQGDLDQNEN